jgi:hypothetical protein
MPMITNEQSEKKANDYVKLDKENTVTLLSNVYKVESHYVQEKKRSVACKGEGCKICAEGKYKKRAEYYYVANVNGIEGILRLPASSFFDMNKIEGMTKKDKRSYSWLIIKEGEGLDTRYTTSKDEPIADAAPVEKNNEKLEKIMTLYEKGLNERYNEQPGEDFPDEIPVQDPTDET